MPTFLIVASENIPVVDLDNTVFLQAGIFLLLMVVLNVLLFQPWLAARDRRAARIGGAQREAVELREAATERQADYDARLAKARDAALDARAVRRREAEGEESKIVDAARKASAEALDETKAQIAVEIESARADLIGRVDALATDITTRVLGRTA